MSRFATVVILVAVAGAGCSSVPGFRSRVPSPKEALTFHASFDRGSDADFAVGDPWIYHAPRMDAWDETAPGLPEGVHVVPGEGRFGGALRFEQRMDPVVFYRAEDNVPWAKENWSGTVSFWLRADLESLPEGFCDPVQITPRGWNDAAFFVEFERRADRVPFRLGVYSDFRVWNPDNRKWDEIPPEERPLVTVDGPPFGADRWTHVAFTWERFNTGASNGIAVLYLDGAQVGALTGRRQTFTWKVADARLLLGVGFEGWIDDLAVFNRALTPEEIASIRRLPAGIRSLRSE